MAQLKWFPPAMITVCAGPFDRGEGPRGELANELVGAFPLLVSGVHEPRGSLLDPLDSHVPLLVDPVDQVLGALRLCGAKTLQGEWGGTVAPQSLRRARRYSTCSPRRISVCLPLHVFCPMSIRSRRVERDLRQIVDPSRR